MSQDRLTSGPIHRIERLEGRRLLSFAPIGVKGVAAGLDPSSAYDVAVAGNGDFIVVSVLVDASDPANVTRDLKAQRYSAAGAATGDVLTIDTADDIEGELDVAMDADGDAVVAYKKGDLDSHVVRISRTGAVSAPQHIATLTFDIDVSMADDGTYFVAYFQSVPILNIKRFDAAGNALNDIYADHLGLDGETTMDIDAKPDGSGAVIAYGVGGTLGEWVKYVQINTTERIGEPKTIVKGATDIGEHASSPSVAVHADGSFVVGFQRFDLTQRSVLNETGYIQRFDASGAPQGSAIQLGTQPPIVDVLPDGGVVAAYQEGSAVRAAHFPAGSASPASIATVETSALDLHAIATDDNGKALVAYVEDELTRQVTGGTITLDGPLHFRRLETGDEPAIGLQGGALSIFGTGADETITVAVNGAEIDVTVNSSAQSFPAADVQFISINGFAGNDTITNNTSLPSTMSGGEGDDTLYGGAGDDRLRGEVGRDSLWGRDGNDTIFGDDGVDSLYGNGGRDRIDGGANSDHMRGNSGRDKLFGGHGNDRIYGSESADWLWGGIGDDQLFGEGSNDVLYGDAGADTLNGVAGDDLLFARGDHAIDELIGGRGRDTAERDDSDLATGIEDFIVVFN